MHKEEDDIIHLERIITNLKNHVSQQDNEIFRQSKQLDALQRRIKRLENRLDDDDPQSPIEGNQQPGDERPPHY